MALLDQATPQAEEIEADFLWECASDGEFSFLDFARDYYGHDPAPVEATAVLLALHAAPVYFHRKGKGRFRKAPPEILAAALASLEKKRQQALAMEGWIAELKAFRLPPEIAGLTDALLYTPDRNKAETKAFETACAETGVTAAQLLFRCGAIKSAYHLHYRRFLHEQFPKGTAFPVLAAPPLPVDLPRADVRAFSIDDANTTEIDDALSVVRLPGIGSRIGIHIAAPGLAIAPGSPLDGIARARLSTVYMPGNKITMLPEAVVDGYTLAGGVDCPAVSLYLTVDDSYEILASESRLEMVHIVANLRHHDIEPLFNDDTVGGPLPDLPFSDELLHLWHFANACEGRRGKPSAMQGNNDYNFAIAGDLADPDACRVEISERKRGSPLDKLVAELMIVANSTWGGLLAEKKRRRPVPRADAGQGAHDHLAAAARGARRGAVRLDDLAAAPLLRPRQPVATDRLPEGRDAGVRAEVGRVVRCDARLRADLRRLRRFPAPDGALLVPALAATTWRQRDRRQRAPRQSVKLDHLPLLLRVPSLPGDLAPGTRVRLAVETIDLLGPEVACRYLGILGDAAAPVEEELEQ